MSRGSVRTEMGQKRIRIQAGGQIIADTTSPLLVWEVPYYPRYYIPAGDVADGVLHDTDRTDRSPSRGTAEILDVRVGDHTLEGAAYRYPEPLIAELTDHVAFEWDAMDAWFEEDEQVYVHTRDPYSRIDVLPSSRHVEVRIDDTVVAESDAPSFLFETGMPRRAYLPPLDVRRDLLVPSDTRTSCPYKGTAHYYSIRLGDQLHEDVVWYYPSPVRESAPISGLLCFYDERVDVIVDGEQRERPRTVFS